MKKIITVIAAAGIALIGTSAHAATTRSTVIGYYNICLANNTSECLNNPGTGNQYHITAGATSLFAVLNGEGLDVMFQTLNTHCVYLDQAHAQVDENSYACNASDLIDNWALKVDSAANELLSAKNNSYMHTADGSAGAAVWSSAPASGDWIHWVFCNAGCYYITTYGQMVLTGRQAQRS